MNDMDAATAFLSPEFFANADGRITCKIPEHREPEFGFILNDMGDAHTIYKALSRHANIIVDDIPTAEDKYLVSLAEDTVDDNGSPTRQVSSMGLERRRRQSLYPRHGVYKRYGISYKTADKSSQNRREWEAATSGITVDEDQIRAVIRQDHPKAANINPRSFRVSSVCVTARASYTLEHELVKDGPVIVYEVCNDACFFASPHADMILGYRKETELEAKFIKLLPNQSQSTSNLNQILDDSIGKIREYLWKQNFIDGVQDASLSKIAHANQSVANHYASESRLSGMGGIDWALLQNIPAIRFTDSGKISSISQMTNFLPKPKLLMPYYKDPSYRDYFPAP